MTALAVDDEVILPAGEYNALVDSLSRCRDKLLEVAKGCKSCGGTGVVSVMTRRRGAEIERQIPCDDCEDLRECLR